MPKKGENIYKRKDGRWEGRYIKSRTISGKAVYGYVYAKTYRDVKAKLKQFHSDLSATGSLTESGNALLLSSAASQWLMDLRPQVKESTYNKYRNQIQSYIIPSMGQIQVQDITDRIVREFCFALLNHGGKDKKGLSPKTVSDTLSTLCRILDFSRGKGYSLVPVSPKIRIKHEEKKIRVLSRNEQNQLCTYLKEHMDERNMGILLCLFTGLRIGELCALTWDDISFSEGTVYVHRTMQRIQTNNESEAKTKILISTPKSSCSIRTIPLPDEMVKLLEAYRKSGYVLTGTWKEYVEPRTMQNHFKRVLRDSGIQSANFHALRHSFATRCVEMGFDAKSLSEILGHASVTITMNRYVHPSMELKRQNMERLSELIAVS